MKEFKWNGPLFPNKYEVKNFELNGEKLTPLAEHMIYDYVKLLTDDENKNMRQKQALTSSFIKNFYSDLKYELSAEQKKLNFPNDYKSLFDKMKKYQIEEKVKNDEYKSTHKEELKKLSEERKSKYGICKIDGKDTNIMYLVESDGIFFGRGENKFTGHWKYEVEEKDICLNMKKEDAPNGNWKSVSFNGDVAFGGTYTEKIGHNGDFIINKSFLFSANNAEVTINRNIEKFEHTKEMIKKWNKLKKHIEENINSNDISRKHTALALYLVYKLGIRIGNEDSSELRGTDVRGATTLQVGDFTFDDEKNIIKLEFIGKDSVKDIRTLKSEKWIIDEIKSCMKNKKSTDLIFNKTSSSKTEEMLREVLPHAKNKMVRTAYGTGLFAYYMQKENWSKEMTDKEFKLAYNNANLEVAKKLNHHSTKDEKKMKESNKKNKDKIKLEKEKLENLKLKYANEITILESKIKRTSDKTKIKEYKDKIKECKNKEVKAIKKFTDLKNELNFKIGVGDLALNTSRTSYSDPRLAFSICKYCDKDPKLIYTKTLLEKFDWAKDVDENYWKNIPVIKD